MALPKQPLRTEYELTILAHQQAARVRIDVEAGQNMDT